MLPQQSACHALARRFRWRKVFPFCASQFPAEKRAFLHQTGALIIFLFSTACGGFFSSTLGFWGPPRPPTFLPALIGANLKPKWPHKPVPSRRFPPPIVPQNFHPQHPHSLPVPPNPCHY